MFGRQRDPVRELANKTKRALEQQNAQINALQRQNQRLAHHASQSQAEQTMEELKRGEEHYAQVVMLAGYAGFFTLWTQTKADMSLWMFASTGALISVSLFVFVSFELYKAWCIGRFTQKHPNAYAHEYNQELARVHKHWHVIFVLSAGTGVISGLSLLFWFVYKTIVSAAALAGAA